MAGVQVRLQQERVRVGLQRAQLRHVLRGLPVHHLAVVEGGLHQDRRVGLPLEVRVGAVRLHGVVRRLLLRVAPLLELAHGEGQRLVEHGVDHVHERHLRDDGLPQIRPHVGDRAHQEPARAAALDDEPVAAAVLPGQEELGGGDEVGEGVLLLHQAPVVVPRLAHLAAAPDVGHGEDDAAVEEAHPVRGEGDGQGEAVRPVAVEEERGGAVLRQPLPVDDRERHLHAVRGGGEDALRLVLRPVVAPEHRLLLEERRRPRVHVVVEDGRRRDERLVAVAEGARCRTPGSPPGRRSRRPPGRRCGAWRPCAGR